MLSKLVENAFLNPKKKKKKKKPLLKMPKGTPSYQNHAQIAYILTEILESIKYYTKWLNSPQG